MLRSVSCFWFTLLSVACAQAAVPGSSPFAAYQGTWRVTRKGAEAKPEQLKNDCAQMGKYFACQQTVNGSIVALVVFIPAESPSRYYTQSLLPDGRATGKDEILISGDQWTFLRRRQDGSKITYYRTTNTFTGRTRIHFEQAESTDQKTWTVTGSGDEVKVGDAK